MKIKTVIVGMLHTNCYILEDEQSGKCAVIDPGAYAERILKELEGKKVEYILLTHGHFDHILAAAHIKRETGARLFIHKSDEHMLSERFVKASGLPKAINDIAVADGYLEEGQSIELGTLIVKVLNTPGHTKGSCVLICNDVMFAGDTLFYESWGRTDFEGGSDREMAESLKRLALLEGDFTVLPGHGEATSLSHERNYNTLMRYAVRQ